MTKAYVDLQFFAYNPKGNLDESNAKVAKLKLQTKAKDTKLRQLEGKGTTSDSASTEKNDAEDLSRLERGHAKLLKKKLEEKEKIIGEKDEVIKIRENQIEAKESVLAERETIMLDLREQLQQKTEAMVVLQSSGIGESGMDEMYAQIVYKDKKLLELNNKILEQDRQVMDLQEYVSEKNEVIRGRDKVIEILQSSLKEKDQNVQDQAMLIAKLTAKVEQSEEHNSLLNEQLQKREHDLKIETDRFSLKLSESQKYFEETLSEREAELRKLHENISIKEKEVLTSQNDIREIINRHERDIQSIMSKSSMNIEDAVINMMEQKIKDSNEVLEGKIKVVEIMQSEMTGKDEELRKNREALRNLKDKLQVTSEQLLLIQANFVEMEAQWRDEKSKLETKVKSLVEKHETEVSEKDLQMQSLQMSLTQYESVYVQASVQYSSLQERYQQTFNELQKVKEGNQPSSVQTSLSSSVSEIQELRTINECLKTEIALKTDELEILKKSTVEDTKSEKSEAKMLKMKAQMTSKIKTLEKELEGLRQQPGLPSEAQARSLGSVSFQLQ
ncbi:hypothetical protein LOTGIDRAFT_160959 [Lottia gigantea]|uniref:Uncharacterized protein n=1 Tax=Lottia gigantea TaxID=225164 RepID=V4AM87_LOTGI|nr:hypothetical protein LOTGIDRAFT_160959 [Lottia gigantea]ESO94726.1 hypothetical protein LOTGIDRAFT_160959 [Lottia gigantea]